MTEKKSAHDWIAENAPMLQNLYQNKYVGNLYDRFVSLPPAQQKQAIYGGVLGTVLVIGVYLLLAYLSLSNTTKKTHKTYQMVNMLLNYQKDLRDRSADVGQLEKNKRLAVAGQLKQHLMDRAKFASISQRMIQIEEKSPTKNSTDEGNPNDQVEMQSATVNLQRVNLRQLKSFLQDVELGEYSLSVSSIKITNDEKIRGFMSAELTVLAYLFPGGEDTL